MVDSNESQASFATVNHTYSQAPKQVKLALILLWLLVAISAAAIVMEFIAAPAMGQSREAAAINFGLWAAVIGTSFSALINVAIGRGKNWARVLTLVLAVAGFAADFLLDSSTDTANAQAIQIANSSLYLIALFLLFATRGRHWFRPRPLAGLQPQANGSV